MDDFDSLVLISCEAMKQDESTDNRYELLVALKVDSDYQLDEQISAALSAQNYRFLYSDQPLAVSEYLHAHPDKNAIALALCKQLSKEQPLVFTQTAVLHHIDQLENLEYLDIAEHPIAPLKELEDIPFWQKPWIDNNLKEILFQPLKHSNGGRLHTYAVLDATLYTQVQGV